MTRWLILFLAVTTVATATADVTIPVTLTDDQYETLIEHAKIQNRLQERAAKKGLKASPLTPEQIFQRDAVGMVNGWDNFQAGAAENTLWAEKSPRAKKRFCERQGIAAKECPK